MEKIQLDGGVTIELTDDTYRRLVLNARMLRQWRDFDANYPELRTSRNGRDVARYINDSITELHREVERLTGGNDHVST